MFPQTSAPSPTPAESGGFYGGSGDIFSNGGYQNFPNIYTAAGSDMQVSLAPLDSNNKSTSYQENLMSAEESNGGDLKKVSYICDPECDFQGCYGQSPTQCVACKHYKLDNACVSRCPPRSFPSQGGSCWPCHESCETCAGAGQDSCVTCALGTHASLRLIRVPAAVEVESMFVEMFAYPFTLLKHIRTPLFDGSSKYQHWVDQGNARGFVADTEQKSCIPCQPNCGSCQDRPDHCTSCDHHLVLYDNKCHAACPANTYETQDYGCEACHASCDQCSGPNETHCVSCRAGRFSLNGTCVDACPDGYYADKKRKECLKCAPGCLLCASGGVCLQCADQWVLNRKNKC
ncbi:unnamed protein product, partial [Timema podura]|nr:unnamed protein product [Timema podura]